MRKRQAIIVQKFNTFTPGQKVIILCDNGIPLDQFWRRRLSEGSIVWKPKGKTRK